MASSGDHPVHSVMKSPALTVERGATLREAAGALRNADVGTLVIMDDDEVAGIVSERDVVRAIADGADPDEIWVADVMSESPRYITVREPTREALRVMLSAGIRHLPVFDEGDLVGIVSMRDLSRDLL